MGRSDVVLTGGKVVNLNVFTNLLLGNLVLVKFRLSISECFDCCSSASHSMYSCWTWAFCKKECVVVVLDRQEEHTHYQSEGQRIKTEKRIDCTSYKI